MTEIQPNPYDLRRRRIDDGTERLFLSHQISPEEQEEKLVGYLELAKPHWAALRYGDHVRYVTKEGAFRTGGYVAKNPLDGALDGEQAVKRRMKLQTGPFEKTKGYASWIVAYEDLARVYIRLSAAELAIHAQLSEAVGLLNENINKLSEHVRRLKAKAERGGGATRDPGTPREARR